MVHIITGENASGKTLCLKDKVLELGKTECMTNLSRLVNSRRKRTISEDKLNILRVNLSYDIEVNATGALYIRNFDTDSEYNAFIADICSNFKYFVYDEPERKVGDLWRTHVYDIIDLLSNTFEDCWIVSHNPCCLLLNDTKYYTCKDKHTLVEISEEEAEEIINSN